MYENCRRHFLEQDEVIWSWKMFILFIRRARVQSCRERMYNMLLTSLLFSDLVRKSISEFKNVPWSNDTTSFQKTGTAILQTKYCAAFSQKVRSYDHENLYATQSPYECMGLCIMIIEEAASVLFASRLSTKPWFWSQQVFMKQTIPFSSKIETAVFLNTAVPCFIKMVSYDPKNVLKGNIPTNSW